jgi:uncharacterized membrane protein YdbT with pleckstrin-like domain
MKKFFIRPASMALFSACRVCAPNKSGRSRLRGEFDDSVHVAVNSVSILDAVNSWGISYFSILLAIRALVVMTTTEFAVTNRRVIAKRGLLQRRTLEILLAKVESVSVRQTILGRLLNFGTVVVTGTGGTKERFTAIVEPMNIRKKINEMVERNLAPPAPTPGRLSQPRRGG